MALNLSTLTSPATSGDVLAEVLTTADFLEPVPVLRNLARGSNKGGDAKQDVALNQPKALPLIKNPAGDLGGYLYIPDVSGNYAEGPSVTIGANETWEGELDMVIKEWPSTYTYIRPLGGGGWNTGFGIIFYDEPDYGGHVRVVSKSIGGSQSQSGITLGTPFNIKYGYDGSDLYVDVNDVRVKTNAAPNQSGSITVDIQLGQQGGISHAGNYAIQKAKLTVNSAVVFDCDFNGSTSIRHGDTKFQAAVGGPVTLTRAGNDPLTVVKKSVLRFDGVDDGLQGLFGQTITDGYMFAAFSVLGDGGEGNARIFGMNQTGFNDTFAGGFFFGRADARVKFATRYNGSPRSDVHLGLFSKTVGDILLESDFVDGSQTSKINNADEDNGANTTIAGDLSAEEFKIASYTTGDNNSALDLEYLALFPADSVPDEATASRIRNYINNRNNVFYRWDTDGYYFFDPQKVDFVGNFTEANTLDGYITGSDNGDTDVRTNLTLVQPTLNDQPSTDGYTITFNDSAEHLEFENGASQSLAGWQICGTSKGTFVYRVRNNGQTQIHLFGNNDSNGFRTAGDLYGLILLPESATGREIEQARKLLIDRGAADGTSSTSLYRYFDARRDIVEFKYIDTSSVNNAYLAWRNCSNMTSFPALDLSNCTSFSNSWIGCSSLTSFSADAKLGTEASNVSFNSAWRSSGLTSFSTPLPSATNVSATWRDCYSLKSFSVELPSATNANQAWFNCQSLKSFSSELPSVNNANNAWLNCLSLKSFSVELPSVNNAITAWYNCTSLTDFSADVFSNWNPSSIVSGVFNNAWGNCPLTAQSVENILTSIDASGKYATSDGTSGGTALADAGIDIDYNGDPLSAATTAAIDSLSGKGWQVYINGELVIPNILDLQPAAAYSLRSFDADADPNVVNVRRSSDGATSDFTASEVSDGTLTDWVNTDVVITSSNFASYLWPFNLYNATSTTTELNQSIAGVDGALKITFGGDTSFLRLLGVQTLGTGKQFKVSVKVYLPSSNDYVDGISITQTGLDNDYPSTTLAFDTWHTIEFTGFATADSVTNFFRIYANNRTSSVDDVLYLKDYDITQLTADGHVTTWYDQSGANHATQTTASRQPKIVDAGTLVTEGGLAAIDFAGTHDSLSYGGLALTNIDEFSIFQVVSFTGYGLNKASFGLSDGTNTPNGGSFFTLYPADTTNGNGVRDFIGSICIDENDATRTGQILLSYLQDSIASREAFVNGSSVGTNTLSKSIATASHLYIGTNDAIQPYAGKIQKTIFFNTDQSSNRTGIENNINDHFDIYS